MNLNVIILFFFNRSIVDLQGQRQEQLLEVQERGVWIPWRLQSSNRAGYLVGGLKPGPGLHPPLALGEEREPPGLDVLSLALSQRR